MTRLLALCLVLLALPVAKLLGWIDWSWWVALAPLWALCVIALIAGSSLILLLWRRPPR